MGSYTKDEQEAISRERKRDAIRDSLKPELFKMIPYHVYIGITTNPHLELMGGELNIKDDITIMQLMTVAPGLVPMKKITEYRAATISFKKHDPFTMSNYSVNKLSFALECINEWMVELKSKI